MRHAWNHLALLLLLIGTGDSPENPLFKATIDDGLTVSGINVRLPIPTLADGSDPEAAKAALKSIAGDDRAIQEFLRDSITAPFVLKTRDVKAVDATIRVLDLWFVVHGRLDQIDPDQFDRLGDTPAVEAGNMRFETKRLPDQALIAKKVARLPAFDGRNEWFVHSNGRLLDRLVVQTTDRIVVTRGANSYLIASRTDPGFDADRDFPNQWSSLTRNGAIEVPGAAKPYRGSLSYTKITELAGSPETLVVEMHGAFVEPLEWFQGNPVLRSKLSLIAQDQVRRLRREIQKKRNEPNKPKKS